jgi:protein-tyrosine phosphatase
MSGDPQAAAPLRIDEVATPYGGAIGMFHCPGRRGTGSTGVVWSRDLAADLDSIENWGAGVLVTLIEAGEFAKYGIPHLPAAVAGRAIRWHHVPIPDLETPDAATLAAWSAAEPDVFAVLREGGRVAVHCAAGLGRTGTIAAKLLVILGASPDDAIRAVRDARPGTIETAAQEAYVRSGPSLEESREQKAGSSDLSVLPDPIPGSISGAGRLSVPAGLLCRHRLPIGE